MNTFADCEVERPECRKLRHKENEKIALRFGELETLVGDAISNDKVINQSMDNLKESMKNMADSIKSLEETVKNGMTEIRESLDRKVDRWVFVAVVGASAAAIVWLFVNYYTTKADNAVAIQEIPYQVIELLNTNYSITQ